MKILHEIFEVGPCEGRVVPHDSGKAAVVSMEIGVEDDNGLRDGLCLTGDAWRVREALHKGLEWLQRELDLLARKGELSQSWGPMDLADDEEGKPDVDGQN